MNLVDSHTHLDDGKFDEDREKVIDRALDAGVTRMLAVGTGGGPPDLEAGVRLADTYRFVYASVGVHPHEAVKSDSGALREVAELCGLEKTVALGEIGLDYHYDFSPRDTQQGVFREQLRIAADQRLPVIVHTREAWEDTIRILGEDWEPTGLGGIMHCFSGGPDEARLVVDMGFYVSFAGIVTFPKATAIQEAAKVVPASRLLVETDCPYLAPIPKRGKRNEPAYTAYTAAKLAELRGEPVEEIARVTTSNFEDLCLPAREGNQ